MEKFRKIISFWLSKLILKILKSNEKSLFRFLEKTTIKLLEIKLHRLFNETCLNNDLLPIYTNIYIYIYIYIYIRLYRFLLKLKIHQILKLNALKITTFSRLILNSTQYHI